MPINPAHQDLLKILSGVTMLIKYYILREIFQNFMRIVSESTHHDVGLSSCTELLLSIDTGCNFMKIQTRFDIKPVQ